MVGFRTILVVLRSPDEAASLCRAASELSGHWQSHVLGLYVLPRLVIHPVHLHKPRIEEFQRRVAALRAEAEAIEATFRDAAARAVGTWEWHYVEAPEATAADVAVDHARRADVVIVGRRTPPGDFVFPDMTMEGLLMSSGRPVLVVPPEPPLSPLHARAAVAWDGSREAARAVFDALPLLSLPGAGKVSLMCDDGVESGALALPATLKRHGIEAEILTVNSRAELPEACQSCQATLLVMGAYGHSRLREYVFGGATDDALSSATLPVLMAH